MRLTLADGIAIPTVTEMASADLLIADATKALKDKGIDQFKLHLIAVVSHLANSIEGPDGHFKAYEQAFKAQPGAPKSMPGHYRSNKSVLVQAVRLGLELLDEGGYPRGKTELEKAIKEAKSETEETPYSKAMKLVEKLRDLAPELAPSERAAVYSDLTNALA